MIYDDIDIDGFHWYMVYAVCYGICYIGIWIEDWSLEIFAVQVGATTAVVFYYGPAIIIFY